MDLDQLDRVEEACVLINEALDETPPDFDGVRALINTLRPLIR